MSDSEADASPSTGITDAIKVKNYNLLIAFLKHTNNGTVDYVAAASDAAIQAKHKKASYDKLRGILKREGLNPADIFFSDKKSKASTAGAAVEADSHDVSPAEPKPAAKQRAGRKLKDETNAEEEPVAKKRKRVARKAVKAEAESDVVDHDESPVVEDVSENDKNAGSGSDEGGEKMDEDKAEVDE
ncbi:hypothetical protein BJ508DRAFT_88269 [Ascobolus immersus RN42]|uniref:Uncharacterized protein n=1 Tax=Ascobolus immersus RN42 TaxID=1160509 RepID=A0A3N4HAR8_ASCIM|nr:hypothetical protein BJ508DRAFT_88269 [Ascobolus immersus RN42]